MFIRANRIDRPNPTQEDNLKTGTVIIVLGIYIFVMGVVGMMRMSSLTPVFIAGGIAAVTIWLGWLFGQGMRPVRSVTMWWLGIVTVAAGYLTFGRLSADGELNAVSISIYGSLALFTLLALVLVYKSAPKTRGRRMVRRTSSPY